MKLYLWKSCEVFKTQVLAKSDGKYIQLNLKIDITSSFNGGCILFCWIFSDFHLQIWKLTFEKPVKKKTVSLANSGENTPERFNLPTGCFQWNLSFFKPWTESRWKITSYKNKLVKHWQTGAIKIKPSTEIRHFQITVWKWQAHFPGRKSLNLAAVMLKVSTTSMWKCLPKAASPCECSTSFSCCLWKNICTLWNNFEVWNLQIKAQR